MVRVKAEKGGEGWGWGWLKALEREASLTPPVNAAIGRIGGGEGRGGAERTCRASTSFASKESSLLARWVTGCTRIASLSTESTSGSRPPLMANTVGSSPRCSAARRHDTASRVHATRRARVRGSIMTRRIVAGGGCSPCSVPVPPPGSPPPPPVAVGQAKSSGSRSHFLSMWLVAAP